MIILYVIDKKLTLFDAPRKKTGYSSFILLQNKMLSSVIKEHQARQAAKRVTQGKR